jgi:DNA-binding IclR family transcriptional regulator
MGQASKARGSGRNATADRAIEILLLFDDQVTRLSAAEVASRLEMSRSTTYRYLQSLRASGFLEEEDGTGRFQLGPEILRLARVARKGFGLSEAAAPVMRELASQTGEDVLLTRLIGAQVACIEREQGIHRVRLSYERGHLLPVHAGASALVVLAFAGEEEIDRILKEAAPLERFTDRTLTSPAEVRRRLGAIRAAGLALSEGEVDQGVRGIAAPVFWPDGRIAAGLSVVGLAYRLTDEVVEEVARKVRAGAEEISERLIDIA